MIVEAYMKHRDALLVHRDGHPVSSRVLKVIGMIFRVLVLFVKS